ncbi:pilus assembly protein [Wohlfahrtiimonas populi]|uniref:hypothetical protein n=1 Tax=Wohlfahrtiimonas populi TaxID=1940240 RepID=UPI00098D0565|nr:hypothetical protein [Wohlfahrtiimonas populi]
MKFKNVYLQILIALGVLFAPVGYTQKSGPFKPSQEPILNTPQPKSNIQMVLDDSGSMATSDIYMLEHAYGQGQPTCKSDAAAVKWGKDLEKEGMYNAFPARNQYVPWDPEKVDDDGMINGKTEPPPYNRCLKVTRGNALSYVVQEILNRYRDKAFVGANVINKNGNLLDNGEKGGLITLPLKDYAYDEQDDFDLKLKPLLDAIEKPSGGTPTGEGLYHAMKILRGAPIPLKAGSSTTGKAPNRYYPYYRYETPLRYRCQPSHIVNMSDGYSASTTVYGIFSQDFPYLSEIKMSSRENDYVIGGVNLIYRAVISSNFYDFGRLAAGLDLRTASKPVWNASTKQWDEKRLDDAGKPWNDPIYSTKMPIILNSVSLGLDPQATAFKNLVGPTGGVSIGFKPGKDSEGKNLEYTAEDLLNSFDSIFSNIIQSSSSTLAVNDKVYADVLPYKVEMINGRLYMDGKPTDMGKLGAIRYSTRYGFGQRYGIISAVVPYTNGKIIDKDGKEVDKIDLFELWNTSATIKPGQGNYVTYLDSKQGYSNYPVGTRLYRVHSGKALINFKDIYQEMTGFRNDAWHYHVHWLYEFTRTSFRPYNLRSRMTPMGSITNSDIRLANKDILNINIAKDKMAKPLSNEMVKWLKFKAQWQPKNFIIASDNDGFINFINAQRGLNKANERKGGQRDTAYFPQIAYRKINDIAVKNQKPILVFEGRTNLVDAKVYQEGKGNYYATLGITGMGGGGKGLVGYRIFASEESTVNDWILGQRKPRLPASYSNPIDKVTPMFEISNEGIAKHRTPGFENLGYTYSGFEYFNRLIMQNGEKRGQAVAVFGNGFGTDKSTVYFIDAYTGKKLNEIVLNHQGGGAATPAIIVKADANGGQIIDRLYVGDYSGTLYKIDFNGNDFTDNSEIKVTALFKAPITNIGQSAISTKPLVIKNKEGSMQVFFATGIAANKERDRGDNAAVLHSIYGITDRNLSDGNSTNSALAINNSNLSLSAKLSIKDLKKGDVKYKDGTQIDYQQKNRYEIDIVTPIDQTPDKKLDGWYMQLSSDGLNSGERVIQDPKYDGLNRSVIFSTWGVVERKDVNDNDLPDPCLRDTPFGKMLAFNISTGGKAIGGGHGGLSNVGSVGTIPGGLTGDLIGTAPEDNSTTSLDDLGKELVDELIEIVGVDNSSLTKNTEGVGATCEGNIDAEGNCEVNIGRIPKPEKPLKKGRISITTVL